jgi:hypothetical protein
MSEVIGTFEAQNSASVVLKRTSDADMELTLVTSEGEFVQSKVLLQFSGNVGIMAWQTIQTYVDSASVTIGDLRNGFYRLWCSYLAEDATVQYTMTLEESE